MKKNTMPLEEESSNMHNPNDDDEQQGAKVQPANSTAYLGLGGEMVKSTGGGEWREVKIDQKEMRKGSV